jgi:deoxyadenosine/deoxycytidine kinase
MTSSSRHNEFTIAIVGPCASGKSSLARGLAERGIRARQVVQEHSFVPEMWQIISQPDFLVYLETSFQTCSQRKNLNWRQRDYDEQLNRLAHAKKNCDLLIHTDGQSEEAILEEVLSRLPALSGPRTQAGTQSLEL